MIIETQASSILYLDMSQNGGYRIAHLNLTAEKVVEYWRTTFVQDVKDVDLGELIQHFALPDRTRSSGARCAVRQLAWILTRVLYELAKVVQAQSVRRQRLPMVAGDAQSEVLDSVIRQLA